MFFISSLTKHTSSKLSGIREVCFYFCKVIKSAGYSLKCYTISKFQIVVIVVKKFCYSLETFSFKFVKKMDYNLKQVWETYLPSLNTRVRGSRAEFNRKVREVLMKILKWKNSKKNSFTSNFLIILVEDSIWPDSHLRSQMGQLNGISKRKPAYEHSIHCIWK